MLLKWAVHYFWSTFYVGGWYKLELLSFSRSDIIGISNGLLFVVYDTSDPAKVVAVIKQALFYIS